MSHQIQSLIKVLDKTIKLLIRVRKRLEASNPSVHPGSVALGLSSHFIEEVAVKTNWSLTKPDLEEYGNGPCRLQPMVHFLARHGCEHKYRRDRPRNNDYLLLFIHWGGETLY